MISQYPIDLSALRWTAATSSHVPTHTTVLGDSSEVVRSTGPPRSGANLLALMIDAVLFWNIHILNTPLLRPYTEYYSQLALARALLKDFTTKFMIPRYLG